MRSKLMEICSTSLTFWERQIKTTISLGTSQNGFKNVTPANAGKDEEKLDYLHIVDGHVKSYNHSGK